MTEAQLIICCSKRGGRCIMQAYFTRQTGKNRLLNMLFDPIRDPCFDTALSWDYPSQCWYAWQCNAYIIKAGTWIWIFFFFSRSVCVWWTWAAASPSFLPTVPNSPTDLDVRWSYLNCNPSKPGRLSCSRLRLLSAQRLVWRWRSNHSAGKWKSRFLRAKKRKIFSSAKIK